MMKLLLFCLFLIPLISFWWLFSLMFLLLSFYMLLLPLSDFFIFLSYGFGLDCFSYYMIMLSFWIMFLMVLASFKLKTFSMYKVEFIFIQLILLLFLFLTFSTTNLFLFYFFFESSMVPILMLIFGWGYQPERFLAGMYLLFYTLFGSFPLLLCIFYIFNDCGSLFYFLISLDVNVFIYLSLIIAFLVKMPMFFFHFWLPKAHVEAPVSGSMILAGVLLKLGGYGLYRVFSFMHFFNLNYFWIVLSLFGGLVVGLLCLVQVDIKSLIAYSSVGHMGLVIGGLMTLNYSGILGSLFLMLGHGLCSSALFALANIIYERSHSRSLIINKGFITFMPGMTMFWFLFCSNNMASPPSLNLLGEILLINSILGWNSLTFLFLFMSSFFSCCYSIYLYSVTQHGSLYSGFMKMDGNNIREYLLMVFHFVPLNLLFLSSDLILF
nr:NADH-ubiquinone oxidoreductase chain 4 [Paralycambes pronotalis]